MEIEQAGGKRVVRRIAKNVRKDAALIPSAKQIRAARGDLTQKEFAALVGVNKATVGEWEKGVPPSPASLKKLLAYIK